jgi:regulator of ribosome biosynthesis
LFFTDADYDAAKESRKTRKEHTLKNESQRLRNVAAAQKAAGVTETTAATAGKEVNGGKRTKMDVERELATTRRSTASLGRFDRTLQGDEKRATKGMKRKFEDNHMSAGEERRRELAILSSLSKGPNAAGKRQKEGQGELNARKAIRAISGGKGSASMAGGASEMKRRRK